MKHHRFILIRIQKIAGILTLIFLLNSCAKQNPSEQIEFLAGYWEIKSVSMPDGVKKEFEITTTIDFITIENGYGIRKKVVPQLDGRFLTNPSFEKFSIKTENDSLRLYYETPFDEWKETVIIAQDSLLVVKNRENKVYTYKKFSTFN